MIYFYNYNFIKYLNSAWSFLFLLLFANIALLLLTSTCLADGEINPNPNTNPEDKEIINNLPEDSIIRKLCEKNGMSLSEATAKVKLDIKEIEDIQFIQQDPDRQARLEEMERFFEAEKQRKAQVSVIVSGVKGEDTCIPEGPVFFNKFLNTIKFVIGIIAAAWLGGFFARGFVYTLVRFTQGKTPVCKLPFISILVPVFIIVRIGWLFGISLFIGGVCSSYIDLSTLDPAVVESLIK